MLFLKETTHPVAGESKLYSNKLKNMKLHLTELLNKKLRIEIEIKMLQKTILRRQKEYERSLKIKLSMESSETIDSSPRLEYLREDPQLCNSLQEFDDVSFEILRLLEENDLLETTEK